MHIQQSINCKFAWILNVLYDITVWSHPHVLPDAMQWDKHLSLSTLLHYQHCIGRHTEPPNSKARAPLPILQYALCWGISWKKYIICVSLTIGLSRQIWIYQFACNIKLRVAMLAYICYIVLATILTWPIAELGWLSVIKLFLNMVWHVCA